jgi:hypothetical protein
MVELYLHSPTRLHGVVHNYLNAGITWRYLYDDYDFDKTIDVKMKYLLYKEGKGAGSHICD